LYKCAKLEVADKQILPLRKGETEVEASKRGDGVDFTFSTDLVDLAEFSASPEVPISIKSEPFGVVKPFGEDLKPFQRYFRPHSEP
jgi:hypothetical protein